MTETIQREQTSAGNSFLGGLDPLAKLTSLVLLSAGALGLGGAAIWPVLGLLALGMAASGVGTIQFMKGLKSVALLSLAGVFIHGLSTPGTAIVALWGGGPALTMEGLAAGFAIAFRLTVLAAFARLVTITTEPGDLLNALEKMAGPLKRIGLPVGDFFRSVLLALEVMPILKEEGGAAFSGVRNGKGRLEAFLYGAEELVRRVLRRSDELFENLRTLPSRETREGFGATEWSLIALCGAVSFFAATGGRLP